MSQLFYILHEPNNKISGSVPQWQRRCSNENSTHTHTHTSIDTEREEGRQHYTIRDAWMPTNILLNKNTIEKLPWWSRSGNNNNKYKQGAQWALVAFNSFLRSAAMWHVEKTQRISNGVAFSCCCNSCCCCSCHWSLLQSLLTCKTKHRQS